MTSFRRSSYSPYTPLPVTLIDLFAPPVKNAMLAMFLPDRERSGTAHAAEHDDASTLQSTFDPSRKSRTLRPCMLRRVGKHKALIGKRPYIFASASMKSSWRRLVNSAPLSLAGRP